MNDENKKLKAFILDTIAVEFPIYTEENGSEDAIEIEEFINIVVDHVLDNDLWGTTKQYIKGFIDSVLLIFKFLGILNPEMLVHNKLSTISFDTYGLMRSVIEYMKNQHSYFDFIKNPRIEKYSLKEVVAELETTRVQKHAFFTNSIRSVTIALAVITAECKELNKRVYLLQKHNIIDLNNKVKEMWRLIGKKIRLSDFDAEGIEPIIDTKENYTIRSKQAINRLMNKKDFIGAKGFILSELMSDKIIKMFKLTYNEFITNFLTNSTGPVILYKYKVSDQCGQYTAYTIFPLKVEFNQKLFSIPPELRANYAWFTEEAIKLGLNREDEVPILKDTILLILDYLKNEDIDLPLSIKTPILLEDVHDAKDEIRINKEIMMNYKEGFLYPINEPEKQYKVLNADCLKFLKIVSGVRKGEAISVQEIMKEFPQYYTKQHIYQIVYHIRDVIEKRINKSLIGNVRGSGYYIKDQ